MVIAVTQSDEVNLLTCVIAKQKQDCCTIARVRNPIYSEERQFLCSELKLSMTINPEYEAAREMSRLLHFPSAIEVDTFAGGRIELLRFKLPADSMLCGRALKDIPAKISKSVLICIVERGEGIVIPNGDYVVEGGDVLTVILQPGSADYFFQTIGVRTNRVDNVMIVGGGEITYYLAQILQNSGIEVKIIEKNEQRCELLSEQFPEITVDCADGTDEVILREERLDKMDAFISCTGIDEINAILSLFAQEHVRRKTITKLNHVDFNDVIEKLQLDSVVNPKYLTAQNIVQFVRATSNSMGSNVETLYRLMNNRVEALEFMIHKESRVTGVPLMDMKLKESILIAGIVRDGELIIPGGQDSFQVGDAVIIITTHLGFDDIYDILDER